MACVELQQILGTECIGDSLPKITGNFAALSGGLCELTSSYNTLIQLLSGFATTDYTSLSTEFRGLSSRQVI